MVSGSVHEVVTECPECGHEAEVIEADKLIAMDGRLWIKGPAWSVELVERLGLALQQINEEQPADPIAELAKSNRELARALHRAVDVLQKQNPRTSRRVLALKITKYLANTVFSAVLGAGIQAGVDAATGDAPPATTDPAVVQQQTEQCLNTIIEKRRVPKPRPSQQGPGQPPRPPGSSSPR